MNEMNVPRPNDLDAFWMPFTANRHFKANPRMLARAEGMHYCTPDGREILDGTAGLWCVNAGHGRREDHARRSSSRPAHARLRADLPAWATPSPSSWPRGSPSSRRPGWTTSSSPTPARSAVDTALKIALAYHRARGEAAGPRLIGRERGYHGVGFGGISVGGIGRNRKQFGAAAARRRSPAAHARPGAATPSRAASRSTARISPTTLERLVALHDA